MIDTAEGDPVARIEALLPTPAGVVRRPVGAFDSGDVDAVLAGFTDDARWRTGRSDVSAREIRGLVVVRR